MKFRRPTIDDDMRAKADDVKRYRLRIEAITVELKECKDPAQILSLEKEIRSLNAKVAIIKRERQAYYAPATVGA